MVELIDTGHISEHRDSLLSDAARTAGGGPLRLFAMLLLTSAVVLGIGFTLSDRVLGPAAALLSRAESLITGHQAVLPGNGNALLATPTLPGTLMLTPLSPAELMQQYPPAAGQSLSDDNFDLPAWQRFQRPAAASADQPRVAVLVTSLGLNKALTAAAILYLPPAVSLSFSPYAPELAAWIDAARAHGFGLAELRAALADGARCELGFGYGDGFVGLDVGAQRQAVAASMFRHRRNIALEGVEVDDESGRCNGRARARLADEVFVHEPARHRLLP